MEQKSSDAKVFSWTLWRIKVPVEYLRSHMTKDTVSLQVRAVARDGEIQSSNIKDLYNIRGVLNNANHKVNFKLPE